MPYFAILEFDRPITVGANRVRTRKLAKLIAPDDVSEETATRLFEAWERGMGSEIPHHIYVRITTYGLLHVPPDNVPKDWREF